MTRRLPAEWELQSAIQFTFPHENSDWAPYLEKVIPCFIACIEMISQFQKILVVCANQNRTLRFLRKAKQENLILIEIPSNDTWARDHGAITVIENGRPVLLDFTFNGWGNKYPAELDNAITKKLHQKGIFGNTKLEQLDLVLEGGAIDSDGNGTLLTTASCLLSPNRNPGMGKAEVENHLKKILGIKRILWIHHGYLAGDDTDGHIDTLARFCSENMIAYIKCRNPNDEHYSELQLMEYELKGFLTGEGKPYQLIPLPMPAAKYAAKGSHLPATYANFLIINNVVLVPIYDVPEDKLALQVLQEAFPTRVVKGINCEALILQHGSLHCISMQYPKGVIH